MTDAQNNPGWARNVVLYGNADTNSAWKPLLGSCPIQVTRRRITAGTHIWNGPNLASIFVYPHRSGRKWILVGAISGTGLEGARTTDRLPLMAPGVAFPDWTVLSSDILRAGSRGVEACGYFDNQWRLTDADLALSPSGPTD